MQCGVFYVHTNIKLVWYPMRIIEIVFGSWNNSTIYILITIYTSYHNHVSQF